jgi:hypothetical protein
VLRSVLYCNSVISHSLWHAQDQSLIVSAWSLQKLIALLCPDKTSDQLNIIGTEMYGRKMSDRYSRRCLPVMRFTNIILIINII